MENTKVKICGITNVEDAQKAVYYGAGAVGFIFHKNSPRYVSPSKVRKIVEALPPFVTPVAVFVNHNERAVKDICNFTNIHTVQFHGTEEPQYCKRFRGYKVIKAFRIQDYRSLANLSSYKVDAYLFDTYVENQEGGTGQKFNWEVLKDKTFDHPIILAGGLNPENIAEAVTIVKPFAVDVSSGVEQTPGIKNHKLIRDLFVALNGEKADPQIQAP